MRLRISIILSICLLSLTALNAQSSLQTYLNSLSGKTGLESALIGISVKRADGTQIASLNENILLSPASCQKVVTTSTALLIFGPNFQFKTQLQYDGNFDPQTGSLVGNIYIRGGGDPTFGSEKFSSTMIDTVLRKFIVQVKKLGVKNIDGRIIGDDEIFESIMAPGTWDWGDIGQYYGAGASALSVCDNMVYYYLRSGNEGTPTKYLRMKPFIPGMTLINDVKSGAGKLGDKSYIFGSEYTYYRHFVGEVSANEAEFKIKGSIPDPSWYAAYLLDSTLKANGIKVSKEPLTTRMYKESKTPYTSNDSRTNIYTLYSPPLKNIIKQINQQSNNLYAEHLHKYISYDRNGNGNNVASSEIVQNYWVNKGIPKNEFIPVDGSGLSRSNGISASTLTDMLIMMKSEKYFEDFYASLPVSGKNGTMVSFGKGTILENNCAAKSGSMTRVRTYTGYVKSKTEKDLVFTVMFNNYTCEKNEIRKICEEVITKIAELN